MQNTDFSIEGLFDFLNAGVSAFHSTAAAAAILEANGYQNCPESAAWQLAPGGKYYTTRNGTAILAWRMPTGELTGWHAAASHSDSPTWRIKTLEGEEHGFARAETEGYGGMLMSTWFDRPLSVAGRLLVRTAEGVESRLVHPERALACIPNLCIHFNREANTGLNYNPQVDLQPLLVVDKVADHARKLKSTGRSRILVIWNLHRAALCRIAEYFIHKIAADPVNPGASDDDKAVQKLCQDFLSGLF